MIIHFDNSDSAEKHLKSKGFELLSNGYWFKKSDNLKACILSIANSSKVALSMRQI